MKTENISRVLDVNLKALILISKAVSRKMIQARSGQIINILSMASKLSLAGHSVYVATKTGLGVFSKILNIEGHPFVVHVNNIDRAAFPNEMLSQISGNDNSKTIELIPHRQYAPLDEIIASIIFFEQTYQDLGGQTLSFGGLS